MTPREARDNLEAVIWRERGGDPRSLKREDVDRILDAADEYAAVTAVEWIDAHDRGTERNANAR